MSVRRYGHFGGTGGVQAWGAISDGEYVLHADHLAAVAEARREAFMEAALKLAYFNGRYIGKETAVESMLEWLTARAEGE